MRRIALISLLAMGAAPLAILACSDDEKRTVEVIDSGTPDGTTQPIDSGLPSTREDFTGDTPVDGGSRITANRTLTKDKLWLMKGVVYVPAGVTLTIEAGTTIQADKATLGTLVIQPGGKINAVGTADAPIVFTSQAAVGQKSAGDWGGVILLGKAPVNGGPRKDAGSADEQAYIEGLPITNENKYGGNVSDDNSGSLAYVRIEYGGVKIGADNEINGLTMGGVGSGTSIHHIQVRHTLDDCFEFFGGTVNADHLVCAYNQDDGIDWDNGYKGNIQYAIVQQDPLFDDDMNGFEADNNANGSEIAPISNPTIFNVTLCGQNKAGGRVKFGMLLRRRTAAMIRNTLVWGFGAAIDVKDKGTIIRANGGTDPGGGADTVGAPFLTVQNSWFYNFTLPGLDQGLSLLVDGGAELTFPEAAWLKKAENNNDTETNPDFDCQNQENPNFAPKTAKVGATPTAGFDAAGTYIGAVKDATDTWYKSGKWVAWTKTGF